ncbi:MAG TPA: transcription termination factor NusA [bacterium]|nr:transcription termination factor NusA [bacterium]
MSEILKAIRQICEEKGLSYEAVIETVESALAAAYRKDYGKKNQNIKVEFDPETGKSKVYDVKTVVEDMPEEEIIEEGEEEIAAVTNETASAEGAEGEEEKRRFNPKTEVQITEAKLIKKTAKIGDEIKTKLEVPESYGRMAAQTAKQVIIQRLREAEREMVFADFKDKEHEVVSGVVQRREGRVVLVDLGKSVGVLPPDEQIPGERYNTGDRIKVFVKEVSSKTKGPEIVLSRTSDEILKKVFYLEIPEISNGLIEIKGVAREAGSRSKVAVWTDSDNVDPIGSCVGQRGARIQTIIQELGGEKVDIIAYDEDPVKYISNSLSPAKIINIEIDEAEKKAIVIVSSEQLSLAIGKGGQNARLAAKLTGWKIDIVEKTEDEKSKKVEAEEAEEKKPVVEEVTPEPEAEVQE